MFPSQTCRTARHLRNQNPVRTVPLQRGAKSSRPSCGAPPGPCHVRKSLACDQDARNRPPGTFFQLRVELRTHPRSNGVIRCVIKEPEIVKVGTKSESVDLQGVDL